MKALILIALVSMAACAPKGGSSVSTTVVVSPTPTPTASPSPTPLPTATPLPSPTPTPPLSYTVANHPLSGNTYANSDGPYTMVFHTDGSYIFTDAFHIGYGTWIPDPSPSDVDTSVANFVTYPVTVTPSGAYICLPASGPQNCATPADFAGAVKVTVIAHDLGNWFLIRYPN